MPAGMKPLEKFLKKQTSALGRAGGGPGGAGGPGAGGGGGADKAGGGNAASRRRASLSRVVPFFREPSPEGGQAREVFSPDSEEAPPWPPAATSLNGSACGDVRSPSLSSDEQSSEASLAAESVGGSCGGTGASGGAAIHADTPENIMLAVLDSVAGKRYINCTETLLDDFMLTHPIFLTADTFQQVLLQQYPSPSTAKRDTCRRTRTKMCQNTPTCKFVGLSVGVFCRVYTPDHSYVTIRSRLSCRVGDILALVREKLQYSDEQPMLPAKLVLVAVTSAGEKAVFRPSDEAVFTTLGVNTHLFTCQPSELDSLLPLPEEIHWTPGDSKLHDMSAEEVANQLVAFDWELFSCVHEVEFVCYVFHGERSRWRPLNLELVLQRCSEVQHWVATETLQCQSLPKRVQLLRKFIKIAALCKQQQDLLSFLAVLLGLDNPALSRLRLTWEGLPGKFRKQFQQFENITDPSRNHKSYRDLISALTPPLIPFTPLLLKDLTFLHESCKTFHGQLVNFEKMHKVAEMVRCIRRYRSGQLVTDTETSPSHLQTKAYVRQLHVIDNQNLLFDLSCKLEPRDS
ncbi:rap guanine nucleotide exchange factor-like 1 isoform X2 [Corythoichthys intestinalis]|uniref:rap guanine nucleotide exchange factor-like 1 isoform X2 n=1 Tax=Corythoichthys intestinalis TaxID=161448 RepID=UPI0025A65602|nr:rap guanine nucleotide exchange factor-like 1 isoform X2 [Corythoichthys intestinalis]